jgi:hypothetical protein
METMEQKTQRNIRVQVRYEELMREGKRGHYETMFRIVREEVEAERERCAAIADKMKMGMPGHTSPHPVFLYRGDVANAIRDAA